YRIEPEQPYTSADLDWQDNNSRSSKEMNDRSARPAIKDGKVNLDNVATVYLGYPIWWDQAPHVVNTFIESNDLSGKKIITFCTSGETSIDGSVRQLKSAYPALDFVKGRRLNGASVNEIEKWISSLKK
ncbi:flavodoxin, partial [uncultured Muribaculum sp.]